MNPTAVKEERWSWDSASAYCVAKTLAMVCEGAKKEEFMPILFPMTMVTAMVSPKALPNPKTTAPHDA